MKIFTILAFAFLLFSIAAPAEARLHKRALPPPASSFCNPADIMRPCDPMQFLFGIKSIDVDMKREGRRGRIDQIAARGAGDVIGRPARYIAGRLICAVNVNAALAERGIRGTGSAMAKSFLRWGQSSAPVPGAVAVSSRGRRGGHVAIVSRVEGGRVYVWNPSSRGRGWQEVACRHRAIDFRIPG